MTIVLRPWIFLIKSTVFGGHSNCHKAACPPKCFFPRLVYFFNCYKWERCVFFKRQERADSRASFFTLSVQAFFFSARVEECSTLDKTLRSSRSFSSQPTNQSGLPTILRLNNNGEVNIACLRVFILFTRSNFRTTIIFLCKIMLGETFHSRCVCHVSNHSNHSISMEKKPTAFTAELSAEHLAFLVGLKRFSGHEA